jgi:hypothetical protein
MRHSTTSRIHWLTLAFTLALSSSAFAGSSEDEDLSKARAKFMQATELEQAGNYPAALQTFREVAQVRMTPQVRYHIALCEEKLGKLVTALGGYELALAEAEALGPEFQKEVMDRASALRERIPKILIERGDGAKAATIELDGISLGASSIGIEVPIDPGPHSISAKAPGYEPFSSTVEVPEKQIERVSISLVKLKESESPVIGQNGIGQVVVAEPSKPSRLVPYLVGGFGAAALINAGVFYVLQRGKDNELLDLCGSDHVCGEDLPYKDRKKADTLNNQLRTYSTITTVSLVAGVVAVGTATVLILTEPKTVKPKTAWFFAPEAPGANVGGISLRRDF